MDGLFLNCPTLADLDPQAAYSQIFDQCAQMAMSAAQVGRSEIHHKEQLLEQEIHRLVLEDQKFREAIVDYHTLNEEYNERRQER